MSVLDFSRFRTLFISLLLFFIVMATLLFVNFYANSQINRDSAILDGAGEMSDQFYNLAIDIQELPATNTAMRPKLIEQTAETAEEINILLGLLETGGHYDYGGGDYIDIAAIESDISRESLTNLQQIWQQYQTKLKTNLTSTGNFTALSAYAYKQKDPIYDTIDEIYADRFNNIQKWTQIGRYVLIGGLLFVLLYLTWFVWYFISRLLSSEAKLQQAREQTQEILATINDGLFLLDENLIISDQYSHSLERILHQQQLGGKNFIDILKKLISEQDLEVTKSFIKQLYSSWVVEELITELNPLHNIQVHFDSPDSGLEVAYLDFRFTRVIQNDEIIHILVSVSDVTERVNLGKKLAEEKAQNNRQIDMISTLVTIDAQQLSEFIDNGQQKTTQINEILKQSGATSAIMKQKVKAIYRHVHAIKGEASALKLQPFVDLANKYETNLSLLLDKPTLKGNDFLAQTIILDDMTELLDFVTQLTSRLNMTTIKQLNLAPSSSQAQSVADKTLTITSEAKAAIPNKLVSITDNVQQPCPLAEQLQRFAQDIAHRHQKQVSLSIEGFAQLQDSQLKSVIKDICIQLIRNAVIHGIEPEQQRSTYNKASTGRIEIVLKQTENAINLLVQDDGIGIDFAKLQQIAIDKGIIDGSKISPKQQMSKKLMLALLFNQGISTAATITEDAGRGVGMDVVKSLVQEHGGTIKVASKRHQYTRFMIKLPVNPTQTVAP